MAAPRVILHIGSQKTGTTSIQGFLKTQTEALSEAGFHFVKAGRTNIAHNSIIQLIRKGKGEAVAEEILSEIVENSGKTCIISSEMFFRKDMAEYFAKIFPAALRLQTRVVVYIRRQDKYAESMYKQRVKNGRYQGSPEEYAQTVVNLHYGQTLSHFATAFGIRNLIVRPFERSLFPGGDVLQDFCRSTGIPLELGQKYQHPSANATLSREVSELLGQISRETPKVNTKDIIRHIMHHRPEGTVVSSDCLDLETRRSIMRTYAAENEEVRATYCAALPGLFDLSDLFREDSYPMPNKRQRRMRRDQAEAAVKAAQLTLSQ